MDIDLIHSEQLMKVHEAGHALVAHWLGYAVTEIRLRSVARAHTETAPNEPPKDFDSRTFYSNEVAVLMAGYEAVRFCFGDGTCRDHEQASPADLLHAAEIWENHSLGADFDTEIELARSTAAALVDRHHDQLMILVEAIPSRSRDNKLDGSWLQAALGPRPGVSPIQ